MSDLGALAHSSKPTVGSRWRALSTGAKILLAFFMAFVAYQFVGSVVSGVTGTSNHVTGSSSSLSDSATGTAAYAELLARTDVGVTELDSALATARPSRTTALVILDPTQWTSAQAASAAAFVRAGRTVIASGQSATVDILADLDAARGVRWSAQPANDTPLDPGTPFLLGSAGHISAGTLNSPAAGTFLLGASARVHEVVGTSTTAVAIAVHDGGWFVALSSASALQNANLADADNAAFGVDLVTGTTTSATFDEYVHGIGRGGSGLAGLPAPWRYGLGLALAGILIGVVSAMRRFGPVQRAGRATLPPRVLYVDAMATNLATRRDEEVVAAARPVTRALRRELATRLSQPVDATDADLRAAAARAPGNPQFFESVVARATTPPESARDVVAVGHALAQLAHSTFIEVDGHD